MKIDYIQIPTWYELKKLCNELTGEQLGQSVVVISSEADEDREITITAIEKEGNNLKLL